MAGTRESLLSEEEVREIRRTLWGNEQEGFVNRRRNQRHPFPVTQAVAPVTPGLRTTEKSFREVLCNDISVGGISFFWPTRPHFARVYIALGGKPNLTWIKARVCHYRKTDRKEGAYLVGCEFLVRATSFTSLLDASMNR
jgi:hypothetical protein